MLGRITAGCTIPPPACEFICNSSISLPQCNTLSCFPSMDLICPSDMSWSSYFIGPVYMDIAGDGYSYIIGNCNPPAAIGSFSPPSWLDDGALQLSGTSCVAAAIQPVTQSQDYILSLYLSRSDNQFTTPTPLNEFGIDLGFHNDINNLIDFPFPVPCVPTNSQNILNTYPNGLIPADGQWHQLIVCFGKDKGFVLNY